MKNIGGSELSGQAKGNLMVDAYDVEAVANARINRVEKKNTDKWFYGMCGGMIVGVILLLAVNLWVGVAVCIVALVAFLYYNSKLNQKKVSYKSQLFKEWQQTNTKVS